MLIFFFFFWTERYACMSALHIKHSQLKAESKNKNIEMVEMTAQRVNST